LLDSEDIPKFLGFPCAPEPSVGTMAIVVIHEDGDRSFEMLAIQDE
jgi:hypothetical protein